MENGLKQVRAMSEDADGRLWAGTENGLVFYREGEAFVRVPLPGEASAGQVQFIVPEGKETVWIGTLNNGLYRWRAGQVARLPQDSGFPEAELHSLVIAPDGTAWIGTERGLYRLRMEEVDAVMDGRKHTMQCVSYGQNDGLPNVAFALGFRNPTAWTRDGHLWFATTRGALEMIPSRIQEATPPWPVSIEELQADGVVMARDGRGEVTLPPRPGHVQIHYSLPRLGATGQVRFRYRLLGNGGNNEWIFAENQRVAAFSSLSPGSYRFEVAASEVGGNWLAGMASLAFTVRAEWWQEAWFRVGSWLAGVLGLMALVRYVVHRRMLARMRRLEHEHALEQERTRIARDMHDQIGASLTQIALFAGLAEADSHEGSSAADHAAHVVASAREATVALDEIVWAVNPRNDTLPRLLEYIGQYAADFLHAAGLRCRLDLPSDPPSRNMPADYRHNLFLIVQEALNNAVKYAAASEVRLRAELGAAGLFIEIADDGRGLPEDAARSGGNGLANMAARAATLGGTSEIANQPGGGACLKFQLPWPR
jgi:signal transduction histidine kinase